MQWKHIAVLSLYKLLALTLWILICLLIFAVCVFTLPVIWVAISYGVIGLEFGNELSPLITTCLVTLGLFLSGYAFKRFGISGINQAVDKILDFPFSYYFATHPEQQHQRWHQSEDAPRAFPPKDHL